MTSPSRFEGGIFVGECVQRHRLRVTTGPPSSVAIPHTRTMLTREQRDIIARIAAGERVFAPKDYSQSPDRLTQLVAFKTVVSEIDALFRDGLITRPEKELETFADALYVTTVVVYDLTPFGKDIADIHGCAKPTTRPTGRRLDDTPAPRRQNGDHR